MCGHAALPAQNVVVTVLLDKFLADDDPEQILEAQPDLLPMPDDGSRSLAQSLLLADPAARAAAFAADGGGYAGVMAHPFFASPSFLCRRMGALQKACLPAPCQTRPIASEGARARE